MHTHATVRFLIEKYSSPKGDGNFSNQIILLLSNPLRNIAPRKGTEILSGLYGTHPKRLLRNIAPRKGTETCIVQRLNPCPVRIEKYSSPKGDGNGDTVRRCIFCLLIEKYSSPKGDGNFHYFYNSVKLFIEKYRSPRGDGNFVTTVIVIFILIHLLRNIAPRKGTETL